MNGRKILAGAWAMLFLLGAAVPLPVHAQDKDAQSGQRVILQAQVEGYSGLVKNGKSKAELPDGTAVSVTGEELEDGLLLVVEQITAENQKAYGAIAEALKGKGTRLRIYDIGFVDNEGKRYKAAGQMTISIGLDGAYTSPVVYYTTSSGSATRMESSVKNDAVTFVVDHNGYYALLEKASSGDDAKPGQTPPGQDAPKGTDMPNRPGGTTAGVQTGDDAPIAGLGILGCVSAAGIAALAARCRKKEI